MLERCGERGDVGVSPRASSGSTKQTKFIVRASYTCRMEKDARLGCKTTLSARSREFDSSSANKFRPSSGG